METPHFGAPRQEQPERSARQEKKSRADETSLKILNEIFAIVDQEMEGTKSITFAGREYPISDSYDLRLAREQHIIAHLTTRLEQARQEDDYYLEQSLAELQEFSELNASVIAHSAQLSRDYPQSAEFLIHDGEHRDTSQYS